MVRHRLVVEIDHVDGGQMGGSSCNSILLRPKLSESMELRADSEAF